MFAGLLLVFGLSVASAQDGGLITLEKLVEEWSRLRTEFANEERDWKAREKQWRDEMALLEKEKAQLEAEIEAAKSVARDVEAERVDELRDKERFEQMFAGLPSRLEQAETRLAQWPERLPPGLGASLDDAFKRLPADANQRAALSDGARFRIVIALYSELDKLQHTFHAVKEVLPLPDGSRRELDVLYLGLARAFAVSPDDAYAAVGEPGPDGWTWRSRPDLAPAVRRAVAVFRREQTPELIALPLQVKDVVE
ncbi:MAG: DUF3450 family protein [Verrucomicrobiota bacterium]